uniref:Delta like non-canonical Notch ligand 1 n=2 Tax=Callorhinchus milii TaxID=7868 RepID=V9KPK6_CALMI|eukprot:gi/632942658/ref/XP_007886529.1/ PREDICTED: protein delta homolog 1 [Callorhinchus milii]
MAHHSAASVLVVSLLLPLLTGTRTQGTECKPDCHPLHGFCQDTGECRCQSGWQGDLCDQCTPIPGCLHGSCTKPWQCCCEEGWSGILCDTAPHTCSSEHPCANNSTCIESEGGGYRCICGEEFTGNHCQLRKGNFCINGSLCQNGGSCIDGNGFGSQASCLCLKGFTGVLCETKISDCDSNPCANNGTCTDLVSGYSCLCPLGFTGGSCDYLITSCLSHPCKNGGTCHDLPEGGFDCACLPGYEAETCHEHISSKHDTKQNISKHVRVSWVRHGKLFNPPLHAFHKPTHHQGNEMLKITVKETIHTSNSLLNRSQVICFVMLGLLTCLVILGTTLIIFFSKCKMWMANAKYRQYLRKQKNHFLNDEETSVKIIFPDMSKLTNYRKSYISM